MLILILIVSTSVAENHDDKVDAKAIMALIEDGRPVSYDGRTIKGDLDLSQSNLTITSVFWQSPQGIIYSEDLWLITSPINIIDCDIDGNVNFDNAIFEGPVSFNETFFQGNASFKGSRFGKIADFQYARFMGTSDFRKSKFPYLSTFFNATFMGNAYFDFSQFNEKADFKEAYFNASTSFEESQFNERAEFQGSIFAEDIDFWSSQFDGDARFWNAEFRGDALFNDAMFSKDVEFYEASFSGDAKFYNVTFLGILDLAASSNEGYQRTKFLKDLILDNTKINIIRLSYAEFSNRSIISLNGSNFQNFLAPWSALDGRGSYDNGTFLSLIRNYNELGWFEDADDCHYQYRWIGQDQKHWSWAKLRDVLSLISMGYGVRPTYGFISWFIVVLFFTIIYYKTRCIGELQCIKYGPSLFLESLYQSALIFTTNAKGINWKGGYRIKLDCINHDIRIKYKYLGVIEGIIGWLLMTLFLVTLAKMLAR